MKKRQIRFIIALTALSFLIWITGEFLIGEIFNSYGFSVIWAIICLVGCCAYSLWKCPREPEQDEDEIKQKGDKK